MKITVNKKELTRVMMGLTRAIESNISEPILEGVLVEADCTQVRLTACNSDFITTAALPAKTEICGSAVLPAKILLEITKKSPGKDIEIYVDEKFITKISSGKSGHTLNGMNPQDFPEIPQHKTEQVFNLKGSLLTSMIRQTLHAVSKEGSKPIQSGSLFSLEGETLDVVSVDGYRMALRRENVSSKETLSFIVPRKSLMAILKLSYNEDVEILLSKHHVTFIMGKYTITSQTIEGEFLDYKKVISIDPNRISIIKTKELIEAVELVMCGRVSGHKVELVFNFTNDIIQIEATKNTGKSTSIISHKMQGEDLLIGFNGKYLLEALKNTECDEVELCLSGKLNPIIIKPTEGGSFIFLVIPVRL